MKWFVGLGNPGKEYAEARHNAGWMALDAAARRWNAGPARAMLKGLVSEALVDGEKGYLIKPMTYMNLSGECVRAFLDYFKADVADLVVVYDDMDTAVGSVRLRLKGGPGGHNGMKSIIAHLGTEQFCRIRIGISRPEPGVSAADYVLRPFRKDERELAEQGVLRAAEAMEYCLKHSFEKAMAKFNGA